MAQRQNRESKLKAEITAAAAAAGCSPASFARRITSEVEEPIAFRPSSAAGAWLRELAAEMGQSPHKAAKAAIDIIANGSIISDATRRTIIQEARKSTAASDAKAKGRKAKEA